MILIDLHDWSELATLPCMDFVQIMTELNLVGIWNCWAIIICPDCIFLNACCLGSP